MNIKLKFSIIFLLITLVSSKIFAQQDVPGSKDHPFIPRLNGYYITTYDTPEEGSSFLFQVSEDEDLTVEGTKYFIEYAVKKGAKPLTKTEIFQHFFKTVQSKGGSIPFEDLNDNVATFKSKDEKIWVALTLWDQGAKYNLTILERK